jgi:TRAP-type mannitol/chloroaromatic compound transport system permease small subunit
MAPGMTIAAKATAAIDRGVDVVGSVFAWTSFALVLVMASNVLLRYVFAKGSVWAQELEWHLLVPICLIGMSFALRHGDHVRVDIFFARYPERLKLIIEVIGSLAFLAVALLIIWLSWRYVGQSFRQDEGSANPGGIPYRYMLKAFIPLGFGIFALQSLADAMRAFAKLQDLRLPCTCACPWNDQ